MKSVIASALLGFLLPVAAIMAFNFWQDPYFYYHAPEGARLSTNERWQNAGLIRNLDYDTVIIGTSRSQNFSAAMFAESGWQPLKATAAGSSAREQLATLSLVLQSGRARRILLELSHLSYVSQPPEQARRFPDFLYLPTLETPFLYLLSYDLVIKSWVDFDRTDTALDALNVWWPSHRHKFGEQQFLQGVAAQCDAAQSAPANGVGTLDALALARLERLIDSAPEVLFYGFFPPLAAITLTGYDAAEVHLSTIADRLEFRSAIAQIASAHDNLSVFDYASAEDIVLDMGRYKDPGHFDILASERMAREISRGTGPRIDLADVNGPLLKIRDRVDRSRLPCTRTGLAQSH